MEDVREIDWRKGREGDLYKDNMNVLNPFIQ